MGGVVVWWWRVGRRARGVGGVLIAVVGVVVMVVLYLFCYMTCGWSGWGSWVEGWWFGVGVGEGVFASSREGGVEHGFARVFVRGGECLV
jgi:hypothetical protein